MALDRIIRLIQKTGDRVIVVDQSGEPNYVLMGVADYERLVLINSGVEGLTEDEMLAKINRDIELWKQTREPDDIPLDQRDFSGALGLSGTEAGPDGDFYLNLDDKSPVTEDHYYFEPVE